MTGRERLLKTLQREKVDRVPISPFLYNNSVYEMFDYKPNITSGFDNYHSPKVFDLLEKFVQFNDYFGFDIYHHLGSIQDFYAMNQSWENWNVTIVEEGDNDIRRREMIIRTPGGNLRQTENIRRSSKYLVVSAIDEYLIKSRADFELFVNYLPPPEIRDCTRIARAKKAVGDKGICGVCSHGAFTILNQFMKLEEVMMLPHEDEGYYRTMIDFFTDWICRAVKMMVEAGGDAVETGGHLAGSGVGAAYFEEYVLPYEKRIVDAIHSAGAFHIYHNCGDAAKVMHLYNKMDMDVWGFLTPPPYGDVDLDEALSVLRPDMVLRGNIDQVDFLRTAKPTDIKAKVRDLLLKVKPRGNWILCTTDFPFDGTSYKNIEAFTDAGIEFGSYT